MSIVGLLPVAPHALCIVMIVEHLSPRSSHRTGRRDDRGAPSRRSSRRPGFVDRRHDRGAPSPRSSRRSGHKDDRSRSPPRSRAQHDPYDSPREVRGVRGLQLLANHRFMDHAKHECGAS